MDRLSALDAAFLAIEDRHSPMSIGSAAICGGPPPTDAEINRLFRIALTRVPRYRQRLRFVPFGLNRPVWVDDPDFRLDQHLGRLALPAPGGSAELQQLVARLMSVPLDRERPMWETWVVEGLADGRWALVSKLHHCLADGVSGSGLLTAVLMAAGGLTPDEDPPDHFETSTPPGTARLLASAVVDGAGNSLHGLVSLEKALMAPVQLLRTTGSLLRGATRFGSLLRTLPRTSLYGPISTHRRWGWITESMADLSSVAHAYEVTLNDVALTIVSGALGRLQRQRGELPAEHPVRTLVPVSVRKRDDGGHLNNQVSALVPRLPVEMEDPVERLRAVHQRLADLKASGEAAAGRFMTQLSDSTPWLLEQSLLRISVQLSPQLLTVVTTNVPGPPVPLTVFGRPLLELVPYVPLGYHVRVGIAMMSYAGRFCFGVTADENAMPDMAVLINALHEETSRLIDTLVATAPVVEHA